VLQRAFYLYQLLETLPTTNTMNNTTNINTFIQQQQQHLGNQLTTLIQSTVRVLQQGKTKQPKKNAVPSLSPQEEYTTSHEYTLTNRQITLVTALLDTLQEQITNVLTTTAATATAGTATTTTNDQNRGNFIVQEEQDNHSDTTTTTTTTTEWDALYHVAQQIEQAIRLRVPYVEIVALVEAYAILKARILVPHEQDQQQLPPPPQQQQQESTTNIAATTAATSTTTSLSSPVISFPKEESNTNIRPWETNSAVQARNQLAQQLEQALLRDQDDSSNDSVVVDPVQAFVDSLLLRPNDDSSTPSSSSSSSSSSVFSSFTNPSTSSRNRVKQTPVKVSSSRSPSALSPPLTRPVNPAAPPPPVYNSPPQPQQQRSFRNENNPIIQRQNELARQLEEALLRDEDDENMGNIRKDPVEVFLQSLQTPVSSSTSTALPPRKGGYTEDRINAFIQDLRRIRNMDSPTSPTTKSFARGTYAPPPPSVQTTVSNSLPIKPQRPTLQTTSATTTTTTRKMKKKIRVPKTKPTTLPVTSKTLDDSTTNIKEEVQAMEDNILAYLETVKPTTERVQQVIQQFVTVTVPILQQGLALAWSGLGSIWDAASKGMV
jgi:hypothetical protein